MASAAAPSNTPAEPVDVVVDAAPLLTTIDLCAGYGRSQVLFGVSVQAPQAGAIAILGRNGAGKTTLLKTIAGELPPMAGEIAFDGHRIDAAPMEIRARSGIGYVPQEDAVFAGLSVRENLLLGATTPPRQVRHRRGADDLPEARHTARAGRRHALRRRKKDAGDRKGASRAAPGC
jgi:branched-chain amino acid transport system ATP-binding protein